MMMFDSSSYEVGAIVYHYGPQLFHLTTFIVRRLGICA